MASKEVILLTFVIFIYADVNITIESPYGPIYINGNTRKYVERRYLTNEDLELFSITEERIKAAVKNRTAREVIKVYLKNPKPDDELFGVEYWNEIRKKLTIKVDAVSFSPDTESHVHNYINNFKKEHILLKGDITKRKHLKVLTKWTDQNINVFQNVKLNFTIKTTSQRNPEIKFQTDLGEGTAVLHLDMLSHNNFEAYLKPGDRVKAILKIKKTKFEVRLFYSIKIIDYVGVLFKDGVLEVRRIQDLLQNTDDLEIWSYQDVIIVVYKDPLFFLQSGYVPCEYRDNCETFIIENNTLLNMFDPNK